MLSQSLICEVGDGSLSHQMLGQLCGERAVLTVCVSR